MSGVCRVCVPPHLRLNAERQPPPMHQAAQAEASAKLPSHARPSGSQAEDQAADQLPGISTAAPSFQKASEDQEAAQLTAGSAAAPSFRGASEDQAAGQLTARSAAAPSFRGAYEDQAAGQLTARSAAAPSFRGASGDQAAGQLTARSSAAKSWRKASGDQSAGQLTARSAAAPSFQKFAAATVGSHGFRRAAASKVAPLPQLTYGDRPVTYGDRPTFSNEDLADRPPVPRMRGSSSSRSPPSAPAFGVSIMERRDLAQGDDRRMMKDSGFAALLLQDQRALPPIRRHFESRVDHYCPEAPELPPPLRDPPPSGSLTDRSGRTSRRALPKRAASQSARRSPEDMVQSMLRSSAGFSSASSASPSAEELQEVAEDDEPGRVSMRHTVCIFRRPGGGSHAGDSPSPQEASQTSQPTGVVQKRRASATSNAPRGSVPGSDAGVGAARNKMFLGQNHLDTQDQSTSPRAAQRASATPRFSVQIPRASLLRNPHNSPRGKAMQGGNSPRKSEASPSRRGSKEKAPPTLFGRFENEGTQDILFKLDNFIGRKEGEQEQGGLMFALTSARQGDRKFIARESKENGPGVWWVDEGDDEHSLGRIPLWKHKRDRGQRLQRLDRRHGELRRAPPEDFGSAAAKEQQKICDSIRNNLSALGGQRKQLVELRHSMQSVLKSATAMSMQTSNGG